MLLYALFVTFFTLVCSLHIHVIPHTHLDTVWKMTWSTSEQLFTQRIWPQIVQGLRQDKKRTFTLGDIAFMRNIVIPMDIRDQIEIMSNGVVQHDEALTSLVPGIVNSQMVGHRMVSQWKDLKDYNILYQIDSFGFSKLTPEVSKAFGYDAVFLRRFDQRMKSEMRAKADLEFFWNDVFFHVLYDSYGAPPNFDFDRLLNVISDDEAQQLAEELVSLKRLESKGYKGHGHVLFMFGDDIRGFHMKQNFESMDKVIDKINQMEGVSASYSRVTNYMKIANEYALNHRNEYFHKFGGDFLPYADSYPFDIWSGYYSFKPVIKGVIKYTENLLWSGEIFHNLFSRIHVNTIQRNDEFFLPHQFNVGLMQHHDAITSTQWNQVTEEDLSTLFQVEEKVSHWMAQQISKLCNIQNVMFLKPKFYYEPSEDYHVKNVITATTNILLFNSLGWERTDWNEILVKYEEGWTWEVRFNGEILPSQLSGMITTKGNLEKVNKLIFQTKVPSFSWIVVEISSVQKEQNNFKIENVNNQHLSAEYYYYHSLPQAMIGSGPYVFTSNFGLYVYIGFIFGYVGIFVVLSIRHLVFFIVRGPTEPLAREFKILILASAPTLAVLFFQTVFEFYDFFFFSPYPSIIIGVFVALLVFGISDVKYTAVFGILFFLSYSIFLQANKQMIAQPYLWDEEREWSFPGPFASESITVFRKGNIQFLKQVRHFYDDDSTEIRNIVYGGPNHEVVLRVSTSQFSSEWLFGWPKISFFTDANGFDMIERFDKYLDFLPASYYPIVSMAKLNSSSGNSFVGITNHALGVTEFSKNTLEFMLHRQLSQDDEKGLRYPDQFFDKHRADTTIKLFTKNGPEHPLDQRVWQFQHPLRLFNLGSKPVQCPGPSMDIFKDFNELDVKIVGFVEDCILVMKPETSKVTIEMCQKMLEGVFGSVKHTSLSNAMTMKVNNLNLWAFQVQSFQRNRDKRI